MISENPPPPGTPSRNTDPVSVSVLPQEQHPHPDAARRAGHRVGERIAVGVGGLERGASDHHCAGFGHGGAGVGGEHRRVIDRGHRDGEDRAPNAAPVSVAHGVGKAVGAPACARGVSYRAITVIHHSNIAERTGAKQ